MLKVIDWGYVLRFSTNKMQQLIHNSFTAQSYYVSLYSNAYYQKSINQNENTDLQDNNIRNPTRDHCNYIFNFVTNILVQ